MAKQADEPENILHWLFEAGEEQFLRFVEEVVANPKVGETFAATVKRATRTKGQFDKNIQVILAALNLPSRSDLAKLEAKIENLQGSLVNLNIKVDRVLAQKENKKKRVAPRRTQRLRPGSSVEAES